MPRVKGLINLNFMRGNAQCYPTPPYLPALSIIGAGPCGCPPGAVFGWTACTPTRAHHPSIACERDGVATSGRHGTTAGYQAGAGVHVAVNRVHGL